ncbi:YceD family protein [Mongoliitalea daihaiensis]|uniref:YceD family protein n=1 Tax=Mongoliitalea daihaiensis TaxID=2782006 RepID=UPI001F374EF6|nr:DUF177 domain-containing protein [Mongoliitalea daihaiensis]UJP64568.1 DUF177 domain-containing protein [Mongoliitalea daihaiensis]
MKFLRNYNIDIVKLREDNYTFSFDVTGEFFEHFKADEWVKGADMQITALLKKTSAVIEVDFQLTGTVRLICDRSLEEFDYPLNIEEKVIYKYGAAEQELSEDLFIITKDTPAINVAQLLYEFILIAIPAKKIHPDYLDEIDEEDFEGEGVYVYIDGEDNFEEDSPIDSNEKKEIDPRWAILNKLKAKD